MTSFSLKLEEALEALNQIGPALLSKNKEDALKRIIELARKGLQADACTLVLIDTQEREGYQVLNCIEGESSEEIASGALVHVAGREFPMGHAISAQGLINSASPSLNIESSSNHTRAALPCPQRTFSFALKAKDETLGYLHFDYPTSRSLPEHEKRLCRVFASHVVAAIQSFDQSRKQDLSLRFLRGLSQDILSTSSTAFLKRVAKRVCHLLEVPVCIIWIFNPDDGKFRIVATRGKVKKEYRRIKLGINDPGVQHFARHKKGAFVLDVTAPHPKYLYQNDAQSHAWASILSAPMRTGDGFIGIMDVYTTTARNFTESDKELFGALANHVVHYLDKADRLREILTFDEKKERARLDRVVEQIRDAMSMVLSIDTSAENDGLNQTLNLIASLCAKATKASVCATRFLDPKTWTLQLKAFYTEVEIPPGVFPNEPVQIGSRLAGQVAQTGDAYICPDTSQDLEVGEMWYKSGLLSALSVPIKSGGAVIGTISVGSKMKNGFGQHEQLLLERIVEGVSAAIEKANLIDCNLRFKDAIAKSETLQELLDTLVNIARDLMREAVCTVLLLDKDHNGFVGQAYEGPLSFERASLDELFISLDSPSIKKFLSNGEVLYLPDASEETTHPYYSTVRKLKWRSMLAAPLSFKGKLIGVLEVYSLRNRKFTYWHQQQHLKMLAAQASIAIDNLTSRMNLENQNKIACRIAQSNDKDELMKLLLKSGLKIVGSSRGWVGEWDAKKGEIRLAAVEGMPFSHCKPRPLQNDQGAALLNGEVLRIEDTRSTDARLAYETSWEDTRSVLAVPLFINEAEVRLGDAINTATKLIGIINIESPTADAFSHADEDITRSLSHHAAIMLDKLDFEHKLTNLHEMAKRIIGARDWEETARSVASVIKETLSADYVVMSLAAFDLSRVERKYVAGAAQDKQSGDIVDRYATDHEEIATLVIEKHNSLVIGPKIMALDPARNGTQQVMELTRVFVPIPGSSGKVIGVVEAGYIAAPGYRIYEYDVHILQRVVDYAAKALEQRRMGLLEKISHELTSPIIAIRNDADYLERYIDTFPKKKFRQKLNYIGIDCETLLSQVRELEYILGLPRPIVKRDRTDIVAEVIVKNLEQVWALVADENIAPEQISFTSTIGETLNLYLDKVRLNQITDNLLKNAVKYADDDPQKFRIDVDLEETDEDYVISFKDWGKGIDARYSGTIFDEGFRAPEAIQSFTAGRGLGLTIARNIVGELGGELTLVNHREPTEFRMTLPKSLREGPNDVDSIP